MCFPPFHYSIHSAVPLIFYRIQSIMILINTVIPHHPLSICGARYRGSSVFVYQCERITQTVTVIIQTARLHYRSFIDIFTGKSAWPRQILSRLRKIRACGPVPLISGIPKRLQFALISVPVISEFVISVQRLPLPAGLYQTDGASQFILQIDMRGFSFFQKGSVGVPYVGLDGRSLFVPFGFFKQIMVPWHTESPDGL